MAGQEGRTGSTGPQTMLGIPSIPERWCAHLPLPLLLWVVLDLVWITGTRDFHDGRYAALHADPPTTRAAIIAAPCGWRGAPLMR